MDSPHRGLSWRFLLLATFCLAAGSCHLAVQTDATPGSANIQGISGTGKIFTFSIRE